MGVLPDCLSGLVDTVVGAGPLWAKSLSLRDKSDHSLHAGAFVQRKNRQLE